MEGMLGCRFIEQDQDSGRFLGSRTNHIPKDEDLSRKMLVLARLGNVVFVVIDAMQINPRYTQ